jgi:hypothetical protein
MKYQNNVPNSQKKDTHAKYSNAWSWSFLISNNSNAVSVKLVGSILKDDSASCDDPIDIGGYGESVSDTGPTISEGHMIESDFSRCRVNSRPDPDELNDSTDDNGEATLFAKCSGDPVRDICCLRRREREIVDNPMYSSAEDTGDDKPGDGIWKSSVSEVGPLAREAAKLLDISGSEINAYDDRVDVVDVVDVVRSRSESPVLLGSSCHMELPLSTLP